MIFESHAHYDDERFDSDRVELLSLMQKKNVGRIINVGSTLKSSQTSLDLAREYEFIYAALGVHPSDISCLEETPEGLDWIYQTAKKEKKVVAIGEIGLDYYWDKEEKIHKKQRQRFLEQLEIAKKLDLPVIIHSRDAAEETLSIMKEAAKQGIRGVIHCYSYSPELAEEYVKLGYYIGVGGVVTFKNGKKLKETVRRIPLKRILVETDCPYMTPSPFRGERNDSTFIPYVIQEIAKLKEITQSEVEDITAKNAYELFSRVK
ncbi:MAG: TatD family hydrolase [Lachnospiraceae bacterium]|nr:TatD family hydrolase [Lachnospiraceae bacterium]